MLVPADGSATLLPSSSSGDDLSGSLHGVMTPNGPIVWGSVEFPWALPSKGPMDMESSMASLTTQADSELAGLSLDSLTDLQSLSEQASPSELVLLHSEALPEIMRVAGRGMDSAVTTEGVPTAEVFRAGSPGPCAVIPAMDPEVYERLLLLALYGEGATAEALHRKLALVDRFGVDLARRVLAELRPVPLRKALNRQDKGQSGHFPCSDFKRMLRNDMRIPPASVSDAEIEGMLSALDAQNVGTFSIPELLDFMEQYSPKRASRTQAVSRPPSPSPRGRPSRHEHMPESPGQEGSQARASFRRLPRSSQKAPLRTRSKEPQSRASSASSLEERSANTRKRNAKPKTPVQRAKKASPTVACDDEAVPDGADGKRSEELKPVKKPNTGRATKERQRAVRDDGDDFVDDIWNLEGSDRLDSGRGMLFFPPVPYLVSIPLSTQEVSRNGRAVEDADDDFSILPTSTTARMSAGQPAHAGLKETAGLLPALISTPRAQRTVKSRYASSLSEHYMPRSARGARFSSFQVAN